MALLDAIVIALIVLLCTCIPLHVLRVIRIRHAIRGWVEEFDAAGAYGPMRALEIPHLCAAHGSSHSTALGLLMRRGIVRQSGPGRFYLEARSAPNRHAIDCIRRAKPADECEYTFPAIEEF